MSFRYEKNNDTGIFDLVFEGWENGIADSAFEGIEQMQNVDIFTYPKMIQAAYKAVKKSGSTVTDFGRWLVRDPKSRDIFMVGDTGRLYVSSDGGASWSLVGSTPSNLGSGIVIWRDYLILLASTAAYAYGPLSGSRSWSSALTVTGSINILAGIWHPATTFQNYDRAVFFGNKNYIGELLESQGVTFNPANAATYTLSGNVLQLPEYNVVKSIGALGNNLLFGTFRGTNILDNSFGEIFPWNAPQPGYNAPIAFSANGVNMIKSQGNVAYVYAGVGADIFYTNGTATQPLKRFYNVIISSSAHNLDPQPGAIDILNTLDILIGMSYLGGTPAPLGVYNLRDSVHFIRNLPSTGNSVGIKIGAVLATGREQYVFSWQDDNGSTTYGVDLVGADGRYTDYSSQVKTDAVPVGIKAIKTTFQELEVRLGKTLGTGDGVRVSYRLDLNSSFTTIFDFNDTTDLYGNLSATYPASINQAQIVQLKVEVKGNALLRDVRLR